MEIFVNKQTDKRKSRRPNKVNMPPCYALPEIWNINAPGGKHGGIYL